MQAPLVFDRMAALCVAHSGNWSGLLGCHFQGLGRGAGKVGDEHFMPVRSPAENRRFPFIAQRGHGLDQLEILNRAHGVGMFCAWPVFQITGDFANRRAALYIDRSAGFADRLELAICRLDIAFRFVGPWIVTMLANQAIVKKPSVHTRPIQQGQYLLPYTTSDLFPRFALVT
jgi:hypothetical protein